MPGQNWSKTWTFYEGEWREGNVPIMGVRDHAAWLCSSVFDGARTFEGVSPDLDLHCARVNASAETMHLKPTVSTEQWLELTREGTKRFDKDAALYIRPNVLGRAQRHIAGGARSGVHEMVFEPLRGSHAEARRLLRDAVALSQAKS